MDGDDFSYIRHVDFDEISAGERYSQKLIDYTSGARNATVAYIQTPPAGGSPSGVHTHPFEQIFYVLEGTMAIEVEGKRFTAEPGSLVVFPAGVQHRNWNETDQPTVHLAISSPSPGPKAPKPE